MKEKQELVIKNKKGTVYGEVTFLAVAGIAVGVLLFCQYSKLSYALIMVGAVAIAVIVHWIVVGRTLTFTPHGITVTFLCFRKSYEWDELELKRYDRFARSDGWLRPYRRGAVFSRRALYGEMMHWWHGPLSYGGVHPMAFIFVTFFPESIPVEKRKGYIWCYTVEETEFRETLTAWGVQLQEV